MRELRQSADLEGVEGAEPPASLRRGRTECGPKGYAGLTTHRPEQRPPGRCGQALRDLSADS